MNHHHKIHHSHCLTLSLLFTSVYIKKQCHLKKSSSLFFPFQGLKTVLTLTDCRAFSVILLMSVAADYLHQNC